MVEWKARTFRIFLFGDYEFLCALYGLSGAAGKHPCLWYTISSDMLVIPLSERGRSTPRTLDSLTENYKKFRGEFNDNIKKANFASTSLTQGFLKSHYPHVCIPGLHLTLGVVLKMVKMLELHVMEMDFKIASRDAMLGNEEHDESVTIHKQILTIQERKNNLEELLESLLDEINLAAMSNDEIDEELESSLEEVDADIGEANSAIVKLRKDLKLSSEPGPCQKSIDPALKQIGVERQAYYGGTLIGNHCHQILKEDNTQALCDSIPNCFCREQRINGISVTICFEAERYKKKLT